MPSNHEPVITLGEGKIPCLPARVRPGLPAQRAVTQTCSLHLLVHISVAPLPTDGGGDKITAKGRSDDIKTVVASFF